jgi:hypothetical protein
VAFLIERERLWLQIEIHSAGSLSTGQQTFTNLHPNGNAFFSTPKAEEKQNTY